MKTKSLPRVVSLFAAAVVAVVTLSVLVPATHAVALGPNAATFAYDLAAGANSAVFTPVAEKPVLVMGVQTNLGYRGVGYVTLLRVTSSFLEWTGVESPASAAITSGFSGTAGTHIVYLDYSHLVDIRVNSTDTFIVHNANTIPMAGTVTIIW